MFNSIKYLSGGQVEGMQYLSPEEQQQYGQRDAYGGAWSGGKQAIGSAFGPWGAAIAGVSEAAPMLGGAVAGQEGYNLTAGFTDPIGSRVNMYSDPNYKDLSTFDKATATLMPNATGFYNNKLHDIGEQKANTNMEVNQTKALNNQPDAGEFYLAAGGYMPSSQQMLLNPNMGNPAMTFQGGGDMVEFNGPSHANGGIDISPNTEVEGGETMIDDYIFSDRFPKKKTYAALSKAINKKYEGRKGDKLAEEARSRELQSLRNAQESDPDIMNLREESNRGVQFSGGGPTDPPKNNKSLVEYQEFKKYLEDARQAIGTNDKKKLSELRPDGKLYNTNDLTKDYKEAQRLRKAAGLGMSEEADLVFPHVGQQIRGTVNDWMGTNFAGGGSRQYVGGGPDDYQIDPSIFGTDDWRSLSSGRVTGQPPINNTQTPMGNPNPRSASPAYYDAVNGLGPTTQPSNEPVVAPTKSTQGITPDPSGMPKVTGALFNSVGPMAQLAGTMRGPEVVDYNKIDAEYLNYDSSLRLADRAAALQNARMKKNLASTATSSGDLLGSTAAGASAIAKGLSDTKSGIREREINANAQIKNRVNQANTQIANRELDVNAQNRGRHRDIINNSLTDLGNIGAGYERDRNMYKAQEVQNQRLMNTLNSMGLDYQIDKDGNVTFIKPS